MPQTAWSTNPRALAAALLLIAAACALLLAVPGETVTTKYVNDLFVFLDGAHRIDRGQVPNRDFHTALGPLTFYIPAIGYRLAGDWGAAMPVGMALLTALVAPAAAHIVSSRLRPAIGLPIGAYLLVLLAMPLNPGENIRSLSFAMFYNRIGWVALSLVLLMYLRPAREDRRQTVLDMLCAAALTLLMLYTKASYGFVALAFLTFMTLDVRQRGWALASLAVVIGAALGAEAMWRSTLNHAADLAMAARVSGHFGTPDKIGELLFPNLADLVVFGLIATVALAARRSLRDLLFFGLCVLSGLLLLHQNFQTWGVILLAPAAAVAAEQIARNGRSAGPRLGALAAGLPLAALALIAPPLAQGSAALVLHAAVASAGLGDPMPVPLPRLEGVRLVRLWSEGEHRTFVRYLGTIADGAAALRPLGHDAERLLVLDFANPFSAGLGLAPSQGDNAWYHWGRTLDELTHPNPQDLFRDIAVVMEPKWPIESWTAEGMRRVYEAYLAERYELARETDFWRVYLRRGVDAPSLTPSAGAESPAG